MAEESGKKEEQTFLQKLLFYTTAFFVLLGTFSLFAFLFLVPFVIEPAFTTILMQFSEIPATCITTDTESMRGVSNCSWTSCREGCTKEIYECTQIRVNYKLNAPEEQEGALKREERAIREYDDYPEIYEEATVLGLDPPEVPSPTGLMGNESEWYFVGAKLFPNVKGCGYPPMLNCSIFYKKYLTVGTNYSCYYSRIDPGLVISDLNMWQVYMNLVYAMAIPIPSFIVSVIYLTIAYFYIYNDETEPPRRPPRRREVVEVTPLPISTPVPPPTSGALTPASEIFREDLASFGHQLKVAMVDEMSRESIIPDAVPFVNSNSMNG